MVVPASPIVPGDQDDGIVPIKLPIRALRLGPDGVDDGGDPGRPRTVSLSGVVGLETGGYNPAHLFEIALADIGENVGGVDAIDETVLLPFRPVRPSAYPFAHRAERLKRIGCSQKRFWAGRVVGPGDLRRGGGEDIGHGRVI